MAAPIFQPWKLLLVGPDQLRIEFDLSEASISDDKRTVTCTLDKWQIVGPDIRTVREVLSRLLADLPEEE
jgi:hypothetical protein